MSAHSCCCCRSPCVAAAAAARLAWLLLRVRMPCAAFGRGAPVVCCHREPIPACVAHECEQVAARSCLPVMYTGIIDTGIAACSVLRQGACGRVLQQVCVLLAMRLDACTLHAIGLATSSTHTLLPSAAAAAAAAVRVSGCAGMRRLPMFVRCLG